MNVALAESGGSHLYKAGLLAELLHTSMEYLEIEGAAVAHTALDSAGEACENVLQRSHVGDVAFHALRSEGLGVYLFLAGTLLLRHVRMH